MAGRLTVAEHHRRWAIWTAVVFALVAGALAAMAFIREDVIARQPWGYVALAVAVLSTLGGSIAAFSMAAVESRGDE